MLAAVDRSGLIGPGSFGMTGEEQRSEGDRDRTCDLRIKSPLLYQLSYAPKHGKTSVLLTCERHHEMGLTPILTPAKLAASKTTPSGCQTQRDR